MPQNDPFTLQKTHDFIHQEFTRKTWADPLLAEHRNFIEAGHIGFGDPAFHYMWKLLIEHLAPRKRLRLLEIGVYKGQVLSLWALLLRNLSSNGGIFAISPMKGDPLPASAWKRRLLALFSARFRERLCNGDFYDDLDYEHAMQSLFQHFRLDPRMVTLFKGLSTDSSVHAAVAETFFDLIYLDGDHTYDVVRADLKFYGQRIAIGGYLVTDDSGASLPGNNFWKGHPSVSRAVDDWASANFRNVLNCGHNRIFQRVE